MRRGCTTQQYDQRLALARAFLDGTDDGPIEHLRREMEQASERLEYERAAVSARQAETTRGAARPVRATAVRRRDVVVRLHVPGLRRDDRVYLIRRGRVARSSTDPPRRRRDAVARLIDEVFTPVERNTAQIPTHEIDELLLLSSWFRRFPESSSARAWRRHCSARRGVLIGCARRLGGSAAAVARLVHCQRAQRRRASTRSGNGDHILATDDAGSVREHQAVARLSRLRRTRRLPRSHARQDLRDARRRGNGSFYRIVDDSGEDFLYPVSHFKASRRSLSRTSATVDASPPRDRQRATLG
jgi:hypothetical protein